MGDLSFGKLVVIVRIGRTGLVPVATGPRQSDSCIFPTEIWRFAGPLATTPWVYVGLSGKGTKIIGVGSQR